MAPPAKPGVTLAYAEMMRATAWAKGTFEERPESDWDPVTKSWPASISGTCRHKAEWLRQALGGELIVGYRTDRRDRTLHAVLAVNIGGHDFVVDKGGIWPKAAYPFEEQPWPPPPQPDQRQRPAPSSACANVAAPYPSPH